MRPFVRIGIATTGLFLAGCSSTGYVRVGKSTLPAKPEGCQLEVFAAEADVKRPFEKLCLLDAKTGSTLYNDRSPEGAMKRLRKAACICGADAVIITSMERKGVSLASWGSSSAQGVAIRFLDAATATPTAASP